jgi:hypothetical protein
MCTFQSLYFSNDGYVVKCKQCGHYQVAFMCMMITLTEHDFCSFHKIVKQKSEDADYAVADNTKCIIIQTPANGVCFLLTKAEVKKFAEILEEADTEAKARCIISLFNS